ncbi:CotH kinase family protein [Ruminococcus sp. NK3A76]|uniref:CotH kinase family protein n=1 Tax=Ruminococcus sp. NK3A76 TaxID=877411 RepID=UPI00048A7D8B|nr:CotH kinase family protein [Ruminococcus sp. NK3A76]
MKKTRTLSLVMALAITFSLAGCNRSYSSSGSSSASDSSSSVKTEDKPDTSSDDESSADDSSKDDDSSADAERNESRVKFSAEGGVYDKAFDLTLDCGEGKVYYTTDGSDPAASSTRMEYTDKIEIKSRAGDKNVVSAVSPTLISGNFNKIDYESKTFVCEKEAPADDKVDKCTVIRASAQDKDGKWSPTETQTYYIGTAEEHIKGLAESAKACGGTLAVVSISTDFDNFFDSAKGIYVKGDLFENDFKKQLDSGELNTDGETARKGIDANYKGRGKEWERPCHVNFFEMSPDSTTQLISQDCGIRIQGNYSRSDLVKGLRLYAKKDYGEKKFEGDVFKGKATDKDGNKLESFKTLTLRAGGNCAFTAKFNDTYWQDVSQSLDCSTKASRPCVVYLNGEYWGLYVLEEDYSDNYFEDHYGVDDKQVVIYKGDAEEYKSGYKLDEGKLPEGENEDYFFKDLKDFFKTHDDLKSKEDYEEFSKLVDVDSVRDYFLAEVWINNKWDWPGKNWSMWKTAEVDESNEYADGRWRFLFYDMEFGGVSGKSDAFTNTVKEDNYKRNGLLDMDTNNPAVLCYAYLMTNDDFKKDFCDKLEGLSNGIYKKDTLLAALDSYESEYGPLYEQFFDRYPDTGSKDEALSGGYASSQCIRDFVEKREDNISGMIKWIDRTLK